MLNLLDCSVSRRERASCVVNETNNLRAAVTDRKPEVFVRDAFRLLARRVIGGNCGGTPGRGSKTQTSQAEIGWCADFVAAAFNRAGGYEVWEGWTDGKR